MKRFTYSQNYLSAMVDPQDPKEEEKKAQKKSRQAWLTPGGFQVWGLQSATGSCQQDLRLSSIKETNEVFMEKQGPHVGRGAVLRDGFPPHSRAPLII